MYKVGDYICNPYGVVARVLEISSDYLRMKIVCHPIPLFVGESYWFVAGELDDYGYHKYGE